MDAAANPQTVPNFAKNPKVKPTWQQSIQEINYLLTPTKEIVVVIRPDAAFDTVAAAMALSMSIKKIGRRSQVISPTALDPNTLFKGMNKEDVPDAMVNNLEQVINYLPAKQLQVTIDFAKGSFKEGKLDKTDQGLNLTLVPEDGGELIEPQNVATQIVESKPDALIALELENLFNLNEFYRQNQNFFSKVTIINVDNHNNNMNYGKTNLIDPKAVSMCEMVTLMLYDLRFTLDEEVSKILYAGLKFKTENFSQKYFNANMLEAISISMRYQQRMQQMQTGQK